LKALPNETFNISVSFTHIDLFNDSRISLFAMGNIAPSKFVNIGSLSELNSSQKSTEVHMHKTIAVTAPLNSGLYMICVKTDVASQSSTNFEEDDVEDWMNCFLSWLRVTPDLQRNRRSLSKIAEFGYDPNDFIERPVSVLETGDDDSGSDSDDSMLGLISPVGGGGGGAEH